VLRSVRREIERGRRRRSGDIRTVANPKKQIKKETATRATR
jgi:hypothetical protein